MGEFGGMGSLDGVIIGLSRRYNLFWTPRGQGYKLEPPGPHKEHQGDPRIGDFGGDGSLDGVIVRVSRRLNLFWIAPGQGYKLAPPGPHQEPKDCQRDPKMGDFGGYGSLDEEGVKVSRRFKLFWIPHDQGYRLVPPRGLTDPIRNV